MTRAKWKGKGLQSRSEGVMEGHRDSGEEDIRGFQPGVTQPDRFFNMIAGLWREV